MSDDLGHSEEIVEISQIHDLLHTAYIHQWPFFYMSIVKNHLDSRSTKLLEVDLDSRVFTVRPDVLHTLDSSSNDQVLFRASSGGLSVVFEATLISPMPDQPMSEEPKYVEFDYPKVIRFKQLRKAIRINFTDIDDIPVTSFAEFGVYHQGKVIDISESGAKISFKGNLEKIMTGSEIISDCQMLLPDLSSIRNRIKVLGVNYDENRNQSFLRCQFLEFKRDSDVKLKNLIADTLLRIEEDPQVPPLKDIEKKLGQGTWGNR